MWRKYESMFCKLMIWEIRLQAVLENTEYKIFFVAQRWLTKRLFRHFNKCDDRRKFCLTVWNFWNLDQRNHQQVKSYFQVWNSSYSVNKSIKPLNANLPKWLNMFKQPVGNLPKTCLSVFDHFMGLALKGLNNTLLGVFEKQVDSHTKLFFVVVF